jgi:hypothetical protein
VHLEEKLLPTPRAPRQRIDLCHHSSLSLAEQAMPYPPSFLKQGLKVDSSLSHRRRKIKGRRRNGKRRGLQFKHSPNHIIRHLVVPSTADAVHKLICQKQAEIHRQRQRARRESNLLLSTPSH